jgi:alpha-ketoglutarate-dependent taurine dioxygenase
MSASQVGVRQRSRARVSALFDNHSQTHKHILTRPMASAMGAEVTGVNLGDVSDGAFAEIEAALFHHKMLCFPGQNLSLDAQETLTAMFGSFAVDAFTPGVEGHDNVQHVVKEADEVVPVVFGGSWHTDSAFLGCPPAMSILNARDVPEFGGDTWWTNTGLAYRTLSETMRSMIANLKVHMSAAKVLDGIRRKREAGDGINAVAEQLEEDMMRRGSLHPLVRTHDRTGEHSLYVDQTYSIGIEGLSRREGDALIAFLVEHVTQPAFTCRLRWDNNMVVMWDNRTTLHHAFNDYDGYRREMFRTIVEGEQPR